MAVGVIFHRLVQRDMSGILRYYADEAPASVSDRFFQVFFEVVDKAIHNPKLFHPISTVLRRADIPGFPPPPLPRDSSWNPGIGLAS